MAYLPKDITDLILEKLGRGPRNENLPTLLACSTVHSAFVDECQKYIFRAVTLLAAPATYTAQDPFHGRYKSTIRFAEVLNAKPHLRRYVKDVTYQISKDVYSVHRDSLLQTLGNLRDLVSLRLEGVVNPLHARHPPRLAHLDRETKEGMISVIKRNSLKLLSLRCVIDVPLEFLQEAKCLEELNLARSQLQDTESNGQGPIVQTLPTIKKLKCDPDSFKYFISRYLESHRTGTRLFSHLNHLDLGVFRRDDHYLESLLAEAQCLESLALEIDIWRTPSAIQSKLRSLNHASYQTLSHLTYTITSYLYQPGFAINDPYCALLATPLSNFVALECLRINLIYQGNFNIDWELSFGPMWGRLCEALDPHTAPLKLCKVAVVAHLRTEANNGKHWEDANKVLDHLKALVYPAQFQALDPEHRDGKYIDFSFDLGLSTGSMVRPGGGQDFLNEYTAVSTI